MKKVNLEGYNIDVAAVPLVDDDGATVTGRLIVIESHDRDATGQSPAEVYLLALNQDVSDDVARKLTETKIEVARTMPNAVPADLTAAAAAAEVANARRR